MPALPSWLTDPLWDRFAAMAPDRPDYAETHPLRCHRARIDDRVVFDKIVQIVVFGCGYRKAADAACSTTRSRSSAK